MVRFITNEKNNNPDRESNPTPRMTEEEIENLDLENEKVKELMEQYHEETEKFAIWRGVVTEGFKRWLRRETIYDRDKERISLYVSDDTKSEWQNFINMNKEEYTTISKLIRKSVEYFINIQSKFSTENPLKLDNQAITNISHALKEPLTSIKGFSQLLIENYKDDENYNFLLWGLACQNRMLTNELRKVPLPNQNLTKMFHCSAQSNSNGLAARFAQNPCDFLCLQIS